MGDHSKSRIMPFRKRYRRIVLYFARVILGIVYWDLLLPRIGLRKISQRTRPDRLHKIAVSFRMLAIDMGGVLIKVGQFLSSRVDILPVELTDELAGLQDEVPAEDFAAIKKLAEDELGGPLSEHFAWFEEVPLAAASLGQVHQARLYQPQQDFVEVVVKVQRPDIGEIVKTDLAALETVGKWLQRYPPIRRRANVPALLKDFARVTFDEIDYLTEAENAEIFAANFVGYPEVRVPKVVWTYTTRRVLTLENVLAIKITDYDLIEEAGVPLSEVADRLFEVYLKQIFEDGFFHADPHPGNLFVDPQPEGTGWYLTFVDFGMVGRVPAQMNAGLRELVIGIGTQDARRVVQSYKLLGMLLPTADLKLLEKAEAQLFDRFWGKNMSELQQTSFEEMETFAREFRELLYDMPFQVPQDLIWAARAVAILSGMCTGLYPEFNVWEGITPFAEKLIAQEIRGGWDFWRDELVSQLRTVLTLPRRVDLLLTRIERGELEIEQPGQHRQMTRLLTAIRKVAGAVVFAALLLGGLELHQMGDSIFGSVLLGGAGFMLFWLIFSRDR